jgi:hypothetical protein
MPLALKQRAIFLERTLVAFESLRRQARGAGQLLRFDVHDLRGLVEKRLEESVCPYCQGQLTPADFALDYKNPIARGGKFTFKNLQVCCADCQLLKGALDAQEYVELLRLAASWARPVQKYFLARWRIGADLVPVNLPRVGSLEWFTGAAEPHAPSRLRKRQCRPFSVEQEGDSP